MHRCLMALIASKAVAHKWEAFVEALAGSSPLIQEAAYLGERPNYSFLSLSPSLVH